jgi:hypothetical protein
MNFDDLHDPDPPRPGTATLAAVAGRARQIRRRRTAVFAAGGVLAAAAVAVPAALLASGDDASERMVPATVPAVPSVPETTAASTTTAAPTTTVMARPTVVAQREDGDAVLIDADGIETVLYDEFMPPPGTEGGDSVGVDSIAVTGDGRQFVALCCEPITGSWFEVGAEDAIRYGRGLDVSPDGTRLVASGGSFVSVYAPDGTIVAEADVSASPVSTQLEQAMWLDDDTLALLAFQEGGVFRLLTAGAALDDLDPMGGVVITTVPTPETPWPVLAGVGDDGSILVFQGGDGLLPATTTLQAYDPVTLERRPGSDVTIPAPAIFAWSDGGLLTWIGEDYSLHVGDSVVPGEYLWARPVS